MPQKEKPQKEDQCAVTPRDSANTAGTAGATAAIPEFVKLGVNVARGVAFRSIILGAGAEAAGGALAVFGGPVTLAVIGIGGAVYAYDRYSGGQATRFANRSLERLGSQLQIGNGCK